MYIYVYIYIYIYIYIYLKYLTRFNQHKKNTAHIIQIFTVIIIDNNYHKKI